ncbi:MAG: alcohol dehydrogenase catalytic domain-containing protein, partial [Kiritimatiellales bacterium]
MKALVKTKKDKGFVELQERPVPVLPDQDWVRIAIKFTGVCGTDLHVWRDRGIYWAPSVMGHEFSGEIVEVGTRVKGWKVGDRVVAEPHTKACGQCYLCRQGDIGICREKRSIGWGGVDGSMADYIVMPAHLLHRIPDNVSYKHAALTEPLAIVIHQVLERCGVAMGDFVVVTGSGPIGILAAYVAKKAGAGTVCMTGLNSGKKMRFSVAEKMGVDRIINVQEEDALSVVQEMTGGIGADVVIETTGSEPAIASAFEMMKIRGRISAIGISSNPEVAIPWNKAILKAGDIFFNFSSTASAWDKALRLLENYAA